MRMMIKASSDDGLNWPEDRRVLLDTGRSAGYSCMTMIDDETVGILYEGSEAHMTFQRVPLADLFGGPDSEADANAGDADGAGRLRLALGLSSGMVLQCDRPIVIHGTGTPGRMVEVELGGDRRRAKVEENGLWETRFRPLDASSTPISMTVSSDDERIACDDILIGEVWLCAGQSNMEWPVRRCANATAALEGVMPEGVRMLDLQPGAWTSSTPYEAAQIDRLEADRYFEGGWSRANPDTVANVSAVGWWFGLALHEALGVPVGIVDVAVGGTPTEAWIDRDDLESSEDFAALVAGSWLDSPRLTEFCTRRGNENLTSSMRAGRVIPGDSAGPDHPFKPGFMWSAMAPLQPISCRGVLWYQGESNAETLDRSLENRSLMAVLIDSWRNRLDQRNLPFLYVQLPAMDRPAWPAFRESQRRLLSDRDDLGMAVTIDTGDRNDVHPALKRPVGERLAGLALAGPYRVRGAAPGTGPTLERATPTRGEMRVSFDHVGRGIRTTDDGPVRHLELAGADGVWHAATGEITGGRMLTVTSPAVPDPQFVRYAWTPFPTPPVNLVDSDGLPASPFTTATEYGS
jgi:sialate O-acetylesterase